MYRPQGGSYEQGENHPGPHRCYKGRTRCLLQAEVVKSSLCSRGPTL